MDTRKTGGLVLALAVVLGAGVRAVESQQEPPVQPPSAIVVPEPWIDRVYGRITRYFNARVAAVDSYFGQHETLEPFRESQLRFRLWFEQDRYHTFVRPAITADVVIPKISRRFSLYVDNVSPNAVPGATPAESKESLRLGVRRTTARGRRWQFTKDLSARSSGGLVLEALVAAHYRWYWGHWDGYAGQSVFWNNKESLGGLTRFVMDRKLAPAWYLRLEAGAKYTREREYWTTSQVAKLGWVITEDRAYLIGSLVALSKDRLMDEYRAEMTYRRRIWRPWIFVELTPTWRFQQDRAFASNAGVRAGLDLFFGGVPKL